MESENEILQKGILLGIDGMDGSGKSTVAKLLDEYCEQQQIPHYLTSEPTKNKYGLILRELLKDVNSPAPLDALMFAVDRYNHYFNEILPELKKGKLVISDRFILSSIVYQPLQSKGLISEEWIKTINRYIPQPDITIIMEADPQIAMQRIIAMGKPLEKFENIDFLTKLKKQYYHIFNTMNDATDKEGVYLIDTDYLTPEEVTTSIVENILPQFLEKL